MQKNAQQEFNGCGRRKNVPTCVAMGTKAQRQGEKLICRNAKATFRYEIEERLEAGLVLTGSEVKVLRLGRGDLEGAFAMVEGNEVFLHRMHIPGYDKALNFGHEPRRGRKLLLSRTQIDKWRNRVLAKGYTLVPIRVYFKDGWVKVEIGLAKGKREGDEREKIRKEVDLKEAKKAMRGLR